MMKNKVLASLMAAALIGSSVFSALATAATPSPSPEAAALPAATEEEIVKPTTIEQVRIDELMKQHGWDGLGLTFAKADFYSVFTDEDKAVIESDAKKASMRGILDATTMYIAQKDVQVEGAKYPYQLRIVVFADLKTGLVNAAEIVAYPYPMYSQGVRFYAIDTKQATVDKDMKDFMNNNVYTAPYKEHVAAQILGYRVNAKETTGVHSYFKNEGWDLGKLGVYRNPGAWTPSKVTPEYNPFLRDGDINKAMQASANGGPQVLMLMSGSGFLFAEKPYRIKGTDNYFYIDFCTFGGDPEADDFHPTFSWLMMRPAKYNQDGEFEKFFYPVDTKLSEIVKDASTYFRNASNSAPAGAVN